jgi:hypothetical protein
MSIVISDDPGLSPQTRELHGRIRSDIGGLEKHQQELEADVQQIRSTPAAELTGKQLDLARDIPVRRLNLIRRELSLRNRLATELFPAHRQDRVAYADKTWTEYQRILADVRKKLIDIGYVDGLIPGTDHVCITDDLLHRHPRARQSRIESEDARMRASSPGADEQQNQAAIVRLIEAMESMKRRTLQAVA